MITDSRRLAAMARRGFILWQAGRFDRHWTGQTVRRVHVQPGPALVNWYDTFVYRGREYRLRYVDGCIHPFVFRVDASIPAFV